MAGIYSAAFVAITAIPVLVDGVVSLCTGARPNLEYRKRAAWGLIDMLAIATIVPAFLFVAYAMFADVLFPKTIDNDGFSTPENEDIPFWSSTIASLTAGATAAAVITLLVIFVIL